MEVPRSKENNVRVGLRDWCQDSPPPAPPHCHVTITPADYGSAQFYRWAFPKGREGCTIGKPNILPLQVHNLEGRISISQLPYTIPEKALIV